MTKNNFYITYYARKHQKFITRKGWFDKPDGTKGKSFVSSHGDPCLIYWDLDQGDWRMAVGKAKIKYESLKNQVAAQLPEALGSFYLVGDLFYILSWHNPRDTNFFGFNIKRL